MNIQLVSRTLSERAEMNSATDMLVDGRKLRKDIQKIYNNIKCNNSKLFFLFIYTIICAL